VWCSDGDAGEFISYARTLADCLSEKDKKGKPEDDALAARLAKWCALLQDIFGNPFQSLTLDEKWLTPGVRKLTQDIYESKEFAQMPAVASALEDAGCTNADILNHCRQPGEHVRGCWVVDAILGKK
jgi:hypothetical protein